MNTTALNEVLKNYYNNIQLPESDAIQSVMVKISRTKSRGLNLLDSRKIVIVCILSVVILFTGFTTVLLWQTRNADGEITLLIHPFNSRVKGQQIDVPKNIGDKMKEIGDNLEPGKGVIVFFKGDSTLNTIIKPIAFTNIDEAKAKLSFDFMVPTIIPSDYRLKEAIVHLTAANSYKLEEMKKESIETSKDIIIKELSISPKGNAVKLEYQNSKEVIHLLINQIQGIDIHTDMAGKNSEVVYIGKDQALFIKGKAMNQLVYVIKENNSSLYTKYSFMYFSDSEISKNDIIVMAQSLK